MKKRQGRLNGGNIALTSAVQERGEKESHSNVKSAAGSMRGVNLKQKAAVFVLLPVG
jgi:hypothetical protein